MAQETPKRVPGLSTGEQADLSSS